MNGEWLNKPKKLNRNALLKSWRNYGKNFMASPNVVYKTVHLKRYFQITITFICRLYGKKDARALKDSWVPIMFGIAYHGTIFNWCSILSHNLNQAIKDSKILKTNQTHTSTCLRICLMQYV